MSTPTPGTKGVNGDLLRLQAYGFWVRTKHTQRAVKWDQKIRPDGRPTYRGRCWVEVLEHGAHRAPERFYGADVEAVAPSEWMTYYPAVDEPVCGWMVPEEPGRYCPRIRRVINDEIQPFCPKHMAELESSSEGEENRGSEAESEGEGVSHSE